jgi:hypothetical protein
MRTFGEDSTKTSIIQSLAIGRDQQTRNGIKSSPSAWQCKDSVRLPERLLLIGVKRAFLIDLVCRPPLPARLLSLIAIVRWRQVIACHCHAVLPRRGLSRVGTCTAFLYYQMPQLASLVLNFI